MTARSEGWIALTLPADVNIQMLFHFGLGKSGPQVT